MTSTITDHDLAALKQQVFERPIPMTRDRLDRGTWVEREDGVMVLIIGDKPRVFMHREDFQRLRSR